MKRNMLLIWESKSNLDFRIRTFSFIQKEKPKNRNIILEKDTGSLAVRFYKSKIHMIQYKTFSFA